VEIIFHKRKSNYFFFYKVAQIIQRFEETTANQKGGIERNHMGNVSCRSEATLIESDKRDQCSRIDQLMNLERNSVEAKLTALKSEPNTAAV